ncbi:MAG TPA: hypothetical protein VG735_00565 [Caulobacterales bacterium]|nr:hypothetical protein [Caulobacterales bacterium]
MTVTRRQISAAAGPAIAAFGFLLSATVYFPGLFTPDSMDQFEQSQSGHFTDWHPPVMAMLWRAFNFIHVGPELLFGFHLALFWIGVWAIGDGLTRRGLAYGALFPLIGLLPFVFNYLGLLWKDVAVAAAWTFAAGLAFRRQAGQVKAHTIEQVCVWAAFAYGVLARANTIFAAAPLALYLLGGNLFSRRLWPQIAAMLLIPPLLLAGSAVFNKYVARAEPQYATSSLFLFDLAGISHRLGKNLIPGPWTAAQERQIPNCYGPDKWDHTGMGECAFVTSTLDERDLSGSPILTQAWTSAILSHPMEYLGHRLAYTNELMRWLGPVPTRDAFMETEIADPRYANTPGPLFRAIEAVCEALTDTPLFRPYFWLLLAISAAGLSFAAENSPQRQVAGALSLSALIYLLSYIPFGVASDFRYAYWSIIADLGAGAALLACRWRNARVLGAIASASAIGVIAMIGSSIVSQIRT